jgi:hypothetical protein
MAVTVGRSAMILQVHGGLCNRLRAVLSRIEPGLRVVWPADWEIAGARWDDVFEPLDGVEMLDAVPAGQKPDLVSYEPALVPWQGRLVLLKPGPVIAKRIAKNRELLGEEYAAIHVRRTDLASHAPPGHRDHTPDAFFADFLDELPKGMPVFLATDNAQSQRKWMTHLAAYRRPMRVARVLEHGKEGDGREAGRHTPLADAVVDLFVCAFASKFAGTDASSFSHTVRYLASAYGRNLA